MIGVGTFKVSDKAKEYVNKVLDAERLSYGPFTQKFERVFAASHGSKYGIMSNSGTSALQMALLALKEKYNWSDGDEVIVPSTTFIATSNIVLQCNMTPVFVDIESTFYEINVNKIESKISEKTRCMIPVHLFGLPCDMDPVIHIAKKYNLRIIEDSCEAMFVKYKGRPVGSMSDIGCFSTYVAHILTTGVGGICVTSDPGLAVDLRSIMNHGRDSIYLNIDDDKNKSEEERVLITSKRFSFVRMGYSYRVTEMEGAMGLAQFEEHKEMMDKRWSNAQYLLRKLSEFEHDLQLPTIRDDCEHAFMMFPIVMRHEHKNQIVNFLEKHEIETRDMLPLINSPYYKDIFNLDENDFPVSKWINNSGFYIGCHQGLDKEELDYIYSVINNYFLNKESVSNDACLIVTSNVVQTPAVEILELFYDNLPLGLFTEKILLNVGSNKIIKDFFHSKGFVVLESNLSKGKFINRAINLAKSENIVMVGIDGRDNPKIMDRLLILLKNGADLVIASRFHPKGKRIRSDFLSYRGLGNRFFSFLLSIIFNRNDVTDCNNSYRAFKKSVYNKMSLDHAGNDVMFLMTVKAMENKFNFQETPTVENRELIRTKKGSPLINAVHFILILIVYLIMPKKSEKY